MEITKCLKNETSRLQKDAFGGHESLIGLRTIKYRFGIVINVRVKIACIRLCRLNNIISKNGRIAQTSAKVNPVQMRSLNLESRSGLWIQSRWLRKFSEEWRLPCAIRAKSIWESIDLTAVLCVWQGKGQMTTYWLLENKQVANSWEMLCKWGQ